MNINDTLQYLNIGLPDDIARRKAWGDFEGAIRLIDLRLAQDNLSEAMRACLTAEREIICRIPQNYPFDRAAALAVVRGHIPDFTEDPGRCGCPGRGSWGSSRPSRPEP